MCVSCMDGVANGAETDIDCGGGICSPCADRLACAAPTDCASGRCEGAMCVSCSDTLRNGAETDIDCGGGICSPCADRRMCVAPSDCRSGRCEGGLCISCTDGVINGGEVDVDCGGLSTCGRCPDGRMCSAASDCLSTVCLSMRCAPPGCGDMTRNGLETDVDCGGGSCPGCGDGRMCALGRDCASGVCTGGLCVPPSCTDRVRNGGETDVDCGGATACPRCADRFRCVAPTDCVTAACTRGRCGTFAGCHWGLISEATQLEDAAVQRLFTDNGHTFTTHPMNGAAGVHTSNRMLLDMYTHIVLVKVNRVLTAAEYTALDGWVRAGGRLIVTGTDSLGGPTDSNLAMIMGCSAPGEGPSSTAITVVDATHPIMMGPAQMFTMGMAMTTNGSDHDRCTPVAGARRLVEVMGSSKLQIWEGALGGRGVTVYWNGNGTLSGPVTDWNGTAGTQPALQNLFVNTLEYVCVAP